MSGDGAGGPPALTDTLCTHCGLCCDGSLFADVELTGHAEATRLEVMGLEIEEDGNRALLVQPCRALHGTRCSVYAHRPKCCRSFECGLLQNVRRGAVSAGRAVEQIAEARRRIARVRQMMARWGPVDERLPLREACAEALAAEPDTGPDQDRERTRAELEAAIAEV